MLSEEMWQLPIVLFDAESLARSICVSRAWQRAGERKMRDMIAASIVIQRAVRGALAVVRATRLRGARFEQVLHGRVPTSGGLSDIPNNLWVAYHACVLGSEGEFSDLSTIQCAVDSFVRLFRPSSGKSLRVKGAAVTRNSYGYTGTVFTRDTQAASGQQPS
jgi:hypothetical protein